MDCGNESSAEFIVKPFLRAQGANQIPRRDHDLLGDGSVKRLNDTIHSEVYKALITRSGNEPVQVP